MSRPHSRILVSRFDDCSHARCTPPSCATESSPYSKKTRSYSSSARRSPTVASTVRSPVRSRSLTNSSRKSRRRLLCVREYRAKSAPLTTSGRLTSANTGRSRLVKYGRRTAASSSVKFSEGYTPTVSPRLAFTGPGEPSGLAMVSARTPADGDSSDDDQERFGGDLDRHRGGAGCRDAVHLEADGAASRRRPYDHVDPPSGGLGDARVREVHPLREPTAHPGALSPGHRVHLDLRPTVARVAARDDIMAPEVLAVRDHDRGGRTLVDQ